MNREQLANEIQALLDSLKIEYEREDEQPARTSFKIGEIVLDIKVETFDADIAPDWLGECELCGQSPIVPATGMCGPCTFGDADTLNGNWV
jgi:hypothetical protein